MRGETAEEFRTQPSRLALFYRHVFYPGLLGLVIAGFLDYAAGGLVGPWYAWVFLLAPLVLALFQCYRVELRGEVLTLKSLVRTRRVDLGEATVVSTYTIYTLPLVDGRFLWIRRPGHGWRQVGLFLNYYANHRDLEDAIIRAALRANPEVEFLYEAAVRAQALGGQG
jgi:hypothetical protein